MRSEPINRPTYVLRALERFAEYGDREALVGWDRRFTYTEVRDLVLHLAIGLREQGVRPGMTVAVLVTHPPEAPMLQLALHLLGTRTAWAAGGPVREMNDYLAQVEPDFLVYDTRKAMAERGKELAQRLGVGVACLGPNGAGPDLLAPRPAGAPEFDLDSATGSPESIFQTSGTTGVPKPIHHTSNLYEQTFAIADQWVAAGEPLLRHMTITPMWYVAGQTSALINLFSGGVLFIVSYFVPPEFLAQIERERVNSTFVSPLMFCELLDEPISHTVDPSSMYLFSVGGAALPPARIREGVERFGPCIRVTYGLSESPFISAFPNIGEDPERPERVRSCGPAYGDVRTEIRTEDGTVLGTGEVGELWVASKLNFAGYWGQPEQTANTLRDGWVRTGDLAYLDDEGYLHLVGRSKDLIITGRGCDHIFPRPIEEVLAAHPRVRAAAVIGVPDQEVGEAAHAFLVTTDGATVSQDELAELVRTKLGNAWAPRSMEFLPELPRTGSGKADLRALRQKWSSEHQPALTGAPGAATVEVGTAS